MQALRSCDQLVGGSLWWGAMLAIGLASVANVALFALAKLFDVALRASLGPGRPPQSLDLGLVILATIVPALLGAGLLGLLEHVTDHPARLFRWITIVLALVSLAGPIFQAEGAAATLVLVVMHLVTAAVIVGVLSMVRRRPSLSHAPTSA